MTIEGVYPSGNRIAALLLYRLLLLALERDGLIQSHGDTGITGDLNDAVFSAIVLDMARAVDACRAELDRVGLLEMSQIAVRADGEWRCVHPSPETPVLWLMDTDRHAALWEQLHAKLRQRQAETEKAMEMLREIVRNGGQQQ